MENDPHWLTLPQEVEFSTFSKKKIWILPFGNFEQFWQTLFFHPRNCQNTKINFKLDVDRIFLVILCMADTMRSAANTMHGAANIKQGVADMMCGVADTMLGAANVMHVGCGG